MNAQKYKIFVILSSFLSVVAKNGIPFNIIYLIKMFIKQIVNV